MYKVLIIDDEKDICFLISEILKDEKYTTYSLLKILMKQLLILIKINLI